MRSSERRNPAPQLRIILGAGRSGTTWVARALGGTSTPTRLVQEPLYWMQPRLCLAASSDHTAIGIKSRLTPSHRLLCAYRMLLSERGRLERHRVKQIDRDDDQWKLCLVKEVHALLASEAIVAGLGAPVVFVTRDPIMTVDSILRTNGTGQDYLVAECRHLLRCDAERVGPGFAALRDRYRALSDRKPNCFSPLSLVFTVASLHLYFLRLSRQYPLVELVGYEGLCHDADAGFRSLAARMTLRWDRHASDNLDAYSGKPRTSSPYETRRERASQLVKQPTVIDPQATLRCERLLEGGGYRESFGRHQQPRPRHVAA